MNSFLIMLMFFTRIKINRELDFSEEEFKKGIIKVPFIGLIIGIILFLSSKLLIYIGVDSFIMAILIYTEYILLTGGLHIDGLSDTIDGIYSNRDKERILEIMKDSNIGTFGVLGLLIVSLVNIAVISKLSPEYLIIFPILSRTLVILVSWQNEYARKDGMGKLFIDASTFKAFIVPFILLLPVIVYFTGIYGILGLIIATLITSTWVKMISKKIDGITGDVLGFTIEISQSAFLMVSYLVISLFSKINIHF